ncbi:hypothetical protein [Candidatus Phytoplasma asteris]|uniref:hypothetical protein n=1 Tax=Candidatus Phytoplasma asteris TaxID=85620 RepID=UPI0039E04744
MSIEVQVIMRMFHRVKESEEDQTTQTTQTQIKGHNNKSKRRTTIKPQTPKRITKIKLKTNKRKIVFLSQIHQNQSSKTMINLKNPKNN